MVIWNKIKENGIFILALLLILSVHFAFVSAKEGCHMDEWISFEMANAEYNPWVVPNQPQGRLAKFVQNEIYGDTFKETAGNLIAEVKDVIVNRGNSKLLTYTADVYEEPVWIERETFEAYMTTGQRDSFNLLSVYFNVKDDNHPPIHFMLLHLVASLFPGRFSVWMGCVINVASLVGICICMYKGANLLEEHNVVAKGKGKAWAICAMLLYGLSAGAFATTLLIRMYGVMTFLCVWSFYIHIKKYLTNSFDKRNVLLVIITVAGFLTQYFFLFYCIILAAVTLMLLFVAKRKKEGWIYVRSMGIAALMGVIIYPFSIADVFSSGRGVEALNNLKGGLVDFTERLMAFGGIVLQRCFSFVGIGLVIVVLLFVYFIIRCCVKKCHCKWLVAMLVLPVLGYSVLVAKMSPMYVDRYIMAAFPFICMMAAAALVDVAARLKKLYILLLILVVSVYGFVAIYTYDGSYLYKGYGEQLDIAEGYSELPCICIYEGYGFYDNLPEFTYYDESLLIKLSELETRTDISDIKGLEEVVVIMKPETDAQRCMEVLREYGLEPAEQLLRDGVHEDNIYLFKSVD